jgi:hypothetical protein
MFRNFLSEHQVELHHIATGMPRGNGQVERVMRTVFNLLRASLTDQKESTWVEALANIETVINSTVHATTGFAPTVLQLGSNPRLPATVQMLPEVVATHNYIDPEEAVVHTQVRMTNIEDKQAERFNVTRYGDLVPSASSARTVRTCIYLLSVPTTCRLFSKSVKFNQVFEIKCCESFSVVLVG